MQLVCEDDLTFFPEVSIHPSIRASATLGAYTPTTLVQFYSDAGEHCTASVIRGNPLAKIRET